MLALGKLSAGLAHELNNPASAVLRSAMLMRDAQNKRRHEMIALRSHVIPPEAQEILFRISDGIAECGNDNRKLDALERADLESGMADWLHGRALPEELASDLVDAGIRSQDLEPLAKSLSMEQARRGLRILVYDHQILCLTREIEEASRRISDLVQAIKSYSYMDRTPLSEVDIERGIDVTLRMFQHQLKYGFDVRREFAGNLPKMSANGSELNQIWTNLIDNAIGAMNSQPGSEKTLTVRTVVEPDDVLVEIRVAVQVSPPKFAGKSSSRFSLRRRSGRERGSGWISLRGSCGAIAGISEWIRVPAALRFKCGFR
jgi:signal transduction histidine kinase